MRFLKASIFEFVVLATLLATATGCRCTNCDKVYANWAWEDAAGTKSHFDAYKHVVLVRVDQDIFVDGGPHRYSLHHFKGTAIRTYKGDWKVSEPIAFVEGLDYSGTTTTNRCVGARLVLLINDHTNTEIGIDTGDDFRYEGQFKQVLKCVFPKTEP